jgi:hypothetical protein
MLYKNLLLKTRQKAGLVIDILFPVLIGVSFLLVGNLFKCNGCSPDDKFIRMASAAFALPLIMAVYVPLLVLIAGQFILQNMVQEKENRMRESLRIMSLTPLSYGGSFLIL